VISPARRAIVTVIQCLILKIRSTQEVPFVPEGVLAPVGLGLQGVSHWSSVTFSTGVGVASVQASRKQKGRPDYNMANTSKLASKLKILYGEGDSEVLAAQSVTIQQEGYQVTPAEGRQQVQDKLRQEAFDLVILGPTLTKNDRHHLPYMVKKANQETLVLVAHTDGEGHHAVDATLETGRSMNALLEKIASLRPQQAVAKAAGK
jgi:CheY-like chemotaxis protein